MSEFCEHCDWWFRDPSPAECPGCKIAELEQERDRLLTLIREWKGEAYKTPLGDHGDHAAYMVVAQRLSAALGGDDE